MTTNKGKNIKWKNAFIELETSLSNLPEKNINKESLLKILEDAKTKNSYTPRKKSNPSSKHKKKSLSNKINKNLKKVFDFLGLV